MRRTHGARGVPSSANWNPTKLFIRRQKYAAAMRPVQKDANHLGDIMSQGVKNGMVRAHRIACVGMSVSRNMTSGSMTIYFQRDVRVSFRPTILGLDELDLHNGSHKNGDDMNKTCRWSN